MSVSSDNSANAQCPGINFFFLFLFFFFFFFGGLLFCCCCCCFLCVCVLFCLFGWFLYFSCFEKMTNFLRQEKSKLSLMAVFYEDCLSESTSGF